MNRGFSLKPDAHRGHHPPLARLDGRLPSRPVVVFPVSSITRRLAAGSSLADRRPEAHWSNQRLGSRRSGRRSRAGGGDCWPNPRHRRCLPLGPVAPAAVHGDLAAVEPDPDVPTVIGLIHQPCSGPPLSHEIVFLRLHMFLNQKHLNQNMWPLSRFRIRDPDEIFPPFVMGFRNGIKVTRISRDKVSFLQHGRTLWRCQIFDRKYRDTPSDNS